MCKKKPPSRNFLTQHDWAVCILAHIPHLSPSASSAHSGSLQCGRQLLLTAFLGTVVSVAFVEHLFSRSPHAALEVATRSSGCRYCCSHDMSACSMNYSDTLSEGSAEAIRPSPPPSSAGLPFRLTKTKKPARQLVFSLMYLEFFYQRKNQPTNRFFIIMPIIIAFCFFAFIVSQS